MVLVNIIGIIRRSCVINDRLVSIGIYATYLPITCRAKRLTKSRIRHKHCSSKEIYRQWLDIQRRFIIPSHPRFRTVLIEPCYLMAIDYDRSGQSIAYKLGQCLDTRRRPTTTDRADPR